MPEMTNNDSISLIQGLNRKLKSMKQEYSSFRAHHKECAQFVSPRKGRFGEGGERNKGERSLHRHNDIVNSAAGHALKVARAGLFNGTMSPSRPWFKLETFDKDLMEFEPVRIWLHQVEELIREVMLASNMYNMVPHLLTELLTFATGCMMHVSDFEDVARFYTQTAGSYFIAQDERYRINTLAREFEWQPEQIIRRFGIKNVSQQVRTSYDRGNYSAWYPVRHMVEPNPEYKEGSKFARQFRFRSVYWEPGGSGQAESETGRGILGFGGFKRFPAYVPRWDVTSEDIYGTDCPTMTALGDINQLQKQEKEKGKGLAKMVTPPLQGPPAVRTSSVSQLPGHLTVYDGDDKRRKLGPIYEVRLPLQELRLDMAAVEKRIEKAYHNDLFLAISQMEGIQPRNELDLMTRNEERLVQLGPVLQRIQGEFHNDLIQTIYMQLGDAGVLPPSPKELQGQDLRVKYISMLALAQRAVATQSLDRIGSVVGNLAANGFESVTDKLDADQFVDEYGRAVGVPPRIIRTDDAVAEIRQARAEAQARQQQAMMAEQMGNAAKAASEANMEGDNALTRVTGR